MTALHRRDVPDGFELGDYRSDLWRVGHVFRWSGFYECFLDCDHRISVRPGETVGEAYCREVNDSLDLDHDVFFAAGE